MSLDIKEIEAAASAVAEKSREAVEKRLENTATKDDVSALIAKTADLEAKLLAQGTELAESRQQLQAMPQQKTFRELLKEQMAKVEKELNIMKDAASPKLHIKVAHNMLTTNTVTPVVAGAPPFSLTTFETGLNPLPRRQIFLRQICDERPTTSMFIAWAEIANRQDFAAAVAEGAAKPMSSFDVVERMSKVEKVADLIKTSKENLADMSNMMAEIDGELRDSVNLKLDQLIWNGSGTSPEIKGLNAIAQTVNTTVYAASVSKANMANAIQVTIFIMINSFFTPNYVLVNPIDLGSLTMLKNTNGDSVNDILWTPSGPVISGVPVVANQLVTQGTFMVGDFTKAHLRIREEFNIVVGFDGNDFSNNLVTIIGELRAGFFVKANDIPAFLKGTYATIITAITAP
jgi:HK97 family phage major capsid protein